MSKIVLPAQTVEMDTPAGIDPVWYEKLQALVASSNQFSNYFGSTGPSKFTTSLGADVLLNNTANYFDGPGVAQGAAGTWFVAGTVTVVDTAAANIFCKLWDGTSLIASSTVFIPTANAFLPVSLSGFIASPAGNLRISCRDITNASGKIAFNQTGNAKDSTISAFRIA